MQFLNISNHPSSSWTSQQLEAAASLGGQPSDIRFPNVDPRWTTEEIEINAADLVSRLDLNGVECGMVAGEPIMALFVVRELQRLGVTCYSATTERIVEERDGVKTSRFTFVRFREWPTL